MKFQSVPDYHMHTPRCNHAIGTIADYASAAVQLGMKEIGMSDHSPMPNDFDKAWRMHLDELPNYLAEIEAAKIQFFNQLTIRTGLEADFHPGTETDVRKMIDAHDWDYVIGSVHYIDDWGFDNPDTISTWDQWDIEDAYCTYFDLVAHSAASGMFDIIGHPDLIKKFGHRPPPNSQRVEQAETAMLEAVLESNTALEISSAGLRKPVAEVYPHGRIIARAAEMGIAFAYGSDAHAPGEVGYAMDECMAMLQACGIVEIATFEKRQRSMQPIVSL